MPRTGGTASSSGMSWVTSLRLPPVSVTASGMALPSVSRWCLLPGRARSTGLGPIASSPLWPGHVRRRPRPASSRSGVRRAARPATHAAGPRRRLGSSPATCASTSSLTRSRTAGEGRPRRSRSTAKTGCRSGRPDRPGQPTWPACASSSDRQQRLDPHPELVADFVSGHGSSGSPISRVERRLSRPAQQAGHDGAGRQRIGGGLSIDGLPEGIDQA